MWVWGSVSLKDFRAKCSGYCRIHGELKLDDECVEVRDGITDTMKKVKTNNKNQHYGEQL